MFSINIHNVLHESHNRITYSNDLLLEQCFTLLHFMTHLKWYVIPSETRSTEFNLCEKASAS